MKKVVAMVLIIGLLFAMSGTMYAAEETTEGLLSLDTNPSVRYTYIDDIKIGLNISSSGLATCTAILDGYSTVDKMRISAYLQRNVGGAWTTVQHWTQDYNTNYAVWARSYYVTSGYQYRLAAYCYMYSGSNVESTYLSIYETY